MKYTFEDLDERIIKTKIALTEAILNLIRQEKKIKVLDICEVADITPMTYYHHFDNKEQLLKYVIKDQLTGILPIPSKLKPINLKHLIYYLVCSFNGFIQKNRETMCSMIKQTTYASYIFDIIRQLVKKEIQNLNLGDLFYIDF
ncbi:MAG: TetR/AcrR family transcriptional regulator [Mycoplasmoidaceae bacterium]|nr:TetR/AcrR family transcriptional regulator [Mycoplasmoidaceae bacterium]